MYSQATLGNKKTYSHVSISTLKHRHLFLTMRNHFILLIFCCLLGFNQSAWGMQIFVKIPTGKTITLDVEPSDTLADLKAKIQDKEALATETQQLTFNNQALSDDNKSLNDYAILAGSTLYLLAPPTPAPINSPFALSLLFLGIIAVAVIGCTDDRRRINRD